MVKSECCESFLSFVSWRIVYVRNIKYHCENFLKELGVEDDDFTVDRKERKLVADDNDAEENVTAAEGQIAAGGTNSSDDDQKLCEEPGVSLSVEEKKKKQTTETSAKEDTAGIGIGHDEQQSRVMQQSSKNKVWRRDHLLTPFCNRFMTQLWVASVFFLCLVNAAHGAPFPCGLGEKFDKPQRACVMCDPDTYADKNQHWDTSCSPCDEPDDYTEIEENCTPTSNTKLRCKPGYTQDLSQNFYGLMCNKCPEYPQPCNSMQTTEMPATMTNSSPAYTEGPTRKTSDKEPPDDSSSHECCTVKIIVIVFAVLVFLVFLFIVCILLRKDICRRRPYLRISPTVLSFS